jgi:hypothetical protein
MTRRLSLSSGYVSKAKTELCATVSKSLSPGFFRRRGQVAFISKFQTELCVTLSLDSFESDVDLATI